MEEKQFMTLKEQRLQRQREQIWNFNAEDWGRQPPAAVEKDKAYMTLHHNVAATYYVAHQNIKAYRILYPLYALAQIGIMVILCATKTPAPVKVASMIVFPLSAASVLGRKNSLIQQAKQAKAECDPLLSRFEKSEPMPPILGSFQQGYPAMHAQTKTIWAATLKHRPVYWRFAADFGHELWKEERERG